MHFSQKKAVYTVSINQNVARCQVVFIIRETLISQHIVFAACLNPYL